MSLVTQCTKICPQCLPMVTIVTMCLPIYSELLYGVVAKTAFSKQASKHVSYMARSQEGRHITATSGGVDRCDFNVCVH